MATKETMHERDRRISREVAALGLSGYASDNYRKAAMMVWGKANPSEGVSGSMDYNHQLVTRED